MKQFKIIMIFASILIINGAFAQSTNTYEYDNLNRLTKVTYANGAVVQYTYDNVGNRLTKVVAGAYVSYSITATADPTAGGSVNGGGTYQHGQTCTLIATANSGYTFVNWTKNGAQVSTNATYTFTVTESAAFVANFTANPVNYTITASANPLAGGTVSGDGSYMQGQNCTLTAMANSGYMFTNWTENGSVVSTNATYGFTVTGDRTLVANFSYNGGNSGGMGALNGVFSVSDSLQVNFSQGNLQYQASTNTWRFATNQYDCIGSDNSNISETYGGWIDLFGWGTSGYNHGAICYQPWSTSSTSTDYYAYGSSNYNLYDQTGQADWGYNVISNGGSQENQWRCLNRGEWIYLFDARSTTSGIRYAKAIVNGINGVILLPDNWSSSIYTLNNTNNREASFNSNEIDVYSWTGTLQPSGAVFIPAAGRRNGLSVSDSGSSGYYWSSSVNGSNPAAKSFDNTSLPPSSGILRRWGCSVRLVHTIEPNTSYSIEATPNPAEGGTITGVGIYEQGQNCTLTATANSGYTFINWTEDGEVVSTEVTYNFTVEGDRNLVANFMEGDLCAITFNLYDSYGDGWNGNKLVVTDDNGTSQQLTFSSGSSDEYCLWFTDGSHVTLGWISGLYTSECSFTVSYSNGNVIYPGSNLSSSFSYEFDVDCEGMPSIALSITTSANPSEGGSVSFGTDFESQQIPPSWTNDSTYPWVITTPSYAGYNGSFCMMSGNGGVHNSTSSIEITVDYVENGTVSFLAGCWGEGSDAKNWDKCRFYIDGIIQMDYGAHQSWENVSFDVTAGNHTFTWTYKKDGSVHPTGDAFFVDDVNFTGVGIGSQFIYGQPCTLTATPNAGYDFINWTENGKVVSTETTYSFTVMSDRNLVALFMPPLNITAIANPTGGGTITGTGEYSYNGTCTLTATPNEGYLFQNWSKNGEVVSCNASYSFAVTENVDFEAVFMPLNGRLVGTVETTNKYLPSFSLYKYTLSQQIYTPNEIGAAGSILTISYYNAGTTKTRNYDIYMVHTDKTIFESDTDWITVTEADLVFSGDVTMTKGYWTTILLNTPFDYNGTSNLAIIVDDNSGNWSNNNMTCRVFNANGNQAIRVYSDNTNYDPLSPPSSYASGNYAGVHSVKNQMILGVMPAYHFVTAGTWGNATNWSGGVRPGVNDAVFIDANCALNWDAEVALLSITPGNTLTLRPNKTLIVTGQLFNTDTTALVIKDGAQLVNASLNVAATMEKDVTAFGSGNPDGWYTIASPMNGMAIAGSNFLIPSYDLYRFNETNLANEEWENYKANLADFTTFEKGRGYLYANSSTFSPAFTGTLNNTAVTYSLTCTNRPNDSLSGFNLIGNPFPHDIYKGAGGAIDNANLASGYYTLTNEGEWEAHTYDEAIQPGQGILVKATAATVLTISKSTEEAYSESGEAKTKTAMLCISVEDDDGRDRAFVYFGQGVGLDKVEVFGQNAPSLAIRNENGDFAIAHFDKKSDVIELVFTTPNNGDATLKVKAVNSDFDALHLIDPTTGADIDLLQQPSYTFSTSGQEGERLFKIRYRQSEK